MVKMLLTGRAAAGSASAAKNTKGPTPRARTRKDLFPDEKDDIYQPRSKQTRGGRPQSGHSGKDRSGRRRRSEDASGAPNAKKSSRRAGAETPVRAGSGEKPARGRTDARKAEDLPPRGRIIPEAPPPPPPEPEGPFPEAFAALNLSPRLLAGIRDLGYTAPTPIQEKTAPLVLEGRDVIGASQTGTGKTAAFGLPVLTKMGAPDIFPRCLILEPTRELASQVVEAFDKFNRYTGLRSTAIYGGVPHERQRRALKKGVDVLVATPGRLLDFLNEGAVSLETVQFLILDEVDRMLDMGFLPDVRRIVERCPAERQTLLFSATMPAQIKTLANWALKNPAEVEIGVRYSPAETVSHYFYPVASDQRQALLLALLGQISGGSIMIFTRTKIQADRLYAILKQDSSRRVAIMHSDISQREREAALAGFREGKFDVIVATDLAARGLDISGVTHVINYQVPENAEDYVHRIGRTGRAQKEGDAFTLLAADELSYAEAIERLIGQKIERRTLEGFPYEYTVLLDPEASSPDKFNRLFRTNKPLAKRRR